MHHDCLTFHRHSFKITSYNIQVFTLQIYFSVCLQTLGLVLAARYDLHLCNLKAKLEGEEVKNHDKHPPPTQCFV